MNLKNTNTFADSLPNLKGIKKKIFMLDSTIISVCIKVFDWAKYKKEKGAIKLHTLLDYDGCMPKYVYMTEGKKAEVEIITNNFSLPCRQAGWTASTIAKLYKQRWSIETFFKELKQNLKIKSFLGTTENAMWIQIWTAMITLLLLKYLKEISKYGWSLSNLIAFLRMNLFVKILLTEWLDNPFKPPEDFSIKNRQESLF
jgi:transposase